MTVISLRKPGCFGTKKIQGWRA